MEKDVADTRPQGVTRPPSSRGHARSLYGTRTRPTTRSAVAASADGSNPPRSRLAALLASVPNPERILRATSRTGDYATEATERPGGENAESADRVLEAGPTRGPATVGEPPQNAATEVPGVTPQALRGDRPEISGSEGTVPENRQTVQTPL